MATSYFYRCKFRSAYIVFWIDREDVAKIDKLHEIYREIQSAENFDDL